MCIHIFSLANKQTTHNSPEDIAAEISSAASTYQGKGQRAEHPPEVETTETTRQVGPPVKLGPPINGPKIDR